MTVRETITRAECEEIIQQRMCLNCYQAIVRKRIYREVERPDGTRRLIPSGHYWVCWTQRDQSYVDHKEHFILSPGGGKSKPYIVK